MVQLANILTFFLIAPSDVSENIVIVSANPRLGLDLPDGGHIGQITIQPQEDLKNSKYSENFPDVEETKGD